jgi:DNA processing protein
MVKGSDAVCQRALWDTFGDAQTAWEAPPEVLHAAGLSKKIVQNLTTLRESLSLEEVWDRIQAQNIQVDTWEDAAYPQRLRDIDNAPPVLYVRGHIDSCDQWAVAIVGIRRITSYGR